MDDGMAGGGGRRRKAQGPRGLEGKRAGNGDRPPHG
jgi:hypothetical protein